MTIKAFAIACATLLLTSCGPGTPSDSSAGGAPLVAIVKSCDTTTKPPTAEVQILPGERAGSFVEEILPGSRLMEYTLLEDGEPAGTVFAYPHQGDVFVIPPEGASALSTPPPTAMVPVAATSGALALSNLRFGVEKDVVVHSTTGFDGLAGQTAETPLGTVEVERVEQAHPAFGLVDVRVLLAFPNLPTLGEEITASGSLVAGLRQGGSVTWAVGQGGLDGQLRQTLSFGGAFQDQTQVDLVLSGWGFEHQAALPLSSEGLPC